MLCGDAMWWCYVMLLPLLPSMLLLYDTDFPREILCSSLIFSFSSFFSILLLLLPPRPLLLLLLLLLLLCAMIFPCGLKTSFLSKKKRPRKRPRSRRTLGRQSSQPHPPQLLVVVVMAEGAHRGEESWEVAPGFEPSSSWRSS